MTTPTTTTPRATLTALRAYTSRRYMLATNLDALQRAARRGDLPLAVDTALYGIGWARETGRLPGGVEMQLRGLGLEEWLHLIVAVARECQVIGEVPAYLILRYGGN